MLTFAFSLSCKKDDSQASSETSINFSLNSRELISPLVSEEKTPEKSCQEEDYLNISCVLRKYVQVSVGSEPLSEFKRQYFTLKSGIKIPLDELSMPALEVITIQLGSCYLGNHILFTLENPSIKQIKEKLEVDCG